MNQKTISKIEELLSSGQNPLEPMIQRYQHSETGEYWLIKTTPTGEIVSSWNQDLTVKPDEIIFSDENNELLKSQNDRLILL